MSNEYNLNKAFEQILDKVDYENNILYEKIKEILDEIPKNQQIMIGGNPDFNKFLEDLKNELTSFQDHYFFKKGESFKLALLNVDYIDTFFNNLDKIKEKIPKNGHMFNWENGNLRLYKYDEKNELILLNENCGFNNCDKLVECFGDVVNVKECYNIINNNHFDTNKLPKNDKERYIMCYKILRGLGFEEVFNNNTYYFNYSKNNEIFEKLIRNKNFSHENLKYLMTEANKGLLEVFNKEKVSGKQNVVQNTVDIINPDKIVVQNTVIPFKNSKLKLDATPEIHRPFYGGVKDDLLKKHFNKLMDIIKNNEIQIEENTAHFLKYYESLLNDAFDSDYNVDVNMLMEYYHQLRTYTTEAMLDKKLIESLKELNTIQKRDDYNEKDFDEEGNYEVSKEKYIVEKQNMFKDILSGLYEYLNKKFPDLISVFKPAQNLFQKDFEIDIYDMIKEASTERFTHNNKNRNKINYYENTSTRNSRTLI